MKQFGGFQRLRLLLFSLLQYAVEHYLTKWIFGIECSPSVIYYTLRTSKIDQFQIQYCKWATATSTVTIYYGSSSTSSNEQKILLKTRSGDGDENDDDKPSYPVTMTYKSRDRSLTEVLIAVVFVCFFVGFVAVLCIGNYYRARRAMERQRQRRLARLSGHAGNGVVGLGSTESPKSTISGGSSAHSIEQRNLLGSSNAMSHRQHRDHGVDLLLQHQ